MPTAQNSGFNKVLNRYYNSEIQMNYHKERGICMSTIVLILSIIVGIVIWVIYHQLFNVAYFGSTAMIAEFFVCIVIGYVIVSHVIGFIFGLFS